MTNPTPQPQDGGASPAVLDAALAEVGRLRQILIDWGRFLHNTLDRGASPCFCAGCELARKAAEGAPSATGEPAAPLELDPAA